VDSTGNQTSSDDGLGGRPDDHAVRVLHIDDDRVSRVLVQRVLQESHAPLRLLVAENGRDGLRIARDEQPAVIVLDLRLGDLHGAAVLDQLRSDLRTAHIAVVVVSGEARPEQIQLLLRSGATAYLTKPVDVWELLHVIEHLAQAHALVCAQRL
jgi:CheY-like chemotaxis protein